MMEDPREVPNNHEGKPDPPAGGAWVPGSGASPQNPPPGASWPPPPGDSFGRWGAPDDGWPAEHGGAAYGDQQQPRSPYYASGQDTANPYAGSWEAESGGPGGDQYGGGQYGGAPPPPGGPY